MIAKARAAPERRPAAKPQRAPLAARAEFRAEPPQMRQRNGNISDSDSRGGH